jgi:V8-like Glu-specific endopeptidase
MLDASEIGELMAILVEGRLDQNVEAVAAAGFDEALFNQRTPAPSAGAQLRKDVELAASKDGALGQYLRACAALLANKPHFANRLEAAAHRLLEPGASSVLLPLISDQERKQRIVVRDDRVDFRWLEQALALGRSVVRLEVPMVERGAPMGGAANGTGFLVDPIHVLTCHHVIEARLRGEKADDADVSAQAKKTRAFFDDVDGGAASIVAVKSALVLSRDLDYAILELAKQPAERTPVRLRRHVPTPQGEVSPLVNIIQHPRGQSKRLAMRNNAVVRVDARDVVYFTDTEEGASGAPVALDDWTVVAVHRTSVTEAGLKYLDRATAGANGGTRIDVIVADLEKRRLLDQLALDIEP